MKIVVIGRGKLGRALAAATQGVLVAGRGRRVIEADLIVLAVPDAKIAEVAQRLQPSRGAVVLHTAGARGLEELQALAQRGHAVGVLHPLVSFASRRHAPPLAGTTFTFFGQPRARSAARRLTGAIGAQLLVLEQQPGAAYHAAAALVANGAAALAAHGVSTLEALGIPRKRAQRALAGLLGSVASNVARLGTPEALTGPVVRGDVDAVKRHLGALRELDPQLAAVYAALQPAILACAREAGLAPSLARAIERALAV